MSRKGYMNGRRTPPFWVTDPTAWPNWRANEFVVYEDDDGVLRYGFTGRTNAQDSVPTVRLFPTRYVLRNGTAVHPAEAQILTGIDHPMAAMDRLREMIHESTE